MMRERCSADRYIRNSEGTHEASEFYVEVPSSTELGVIAHFRKDVRSCVRHRSLVSSLQLRSQSGIEGKGEDNFTGAHNLVRVLYADAPGELISRMPNRAELTGAGMGHAHVNVGVFTNGQGQIRRHGANAVAVGGHPAPGLSTQELPLAALQIH